MEQTHMPPPPFIPIMGPSDSSVIDFFNNYPEIPVVIEGPEFTIDRSYKWY